MPERKKESKSTIYLRGIPVELKRQFRAQCALLGSDMTQEIKRFMSNFPNKAKRRTQ